MIARIKGVISEKLDSSVVIELNGIGYEIFVPANTLLSVNEGDQGLFYIAENIKEDEYIIKEEETRKEIEFIKRKNTSEIKRLSESLRQERMALKFIEKFPKAKLIGSTTKKNLVFKQGLTERKITPEGQVL